MSDSTDDVLIGITASFTPQLLLRPMLGAARGPTQASCVADFNQVHQTLLRPLVEPSTRCPTASWCCGGSRTSSGRR